MSASAIALLRHLQLEPVLVDVGACGAPPAQWLALAPYSVYLGFDPDARALAAPTNFGYKRAMIFNRAVTDRAGQATVEFNLAKSAPCSSVLPLSPGLDNYLFAGLFAVERRISAPAATFSEALIECGLSRIDWLKLDTQGTDLRLYRSVEAAVRSRLLAVDVEPGLIDVYDGEDLFDATHAELRREGFWLSSLEIKETVRMRPATLGRLRTENSQLSEKDAYRALRASPAWCEGRFLRTIEYLADRNADECDFALLWVFAMLERQYGYAMDLGLAYEARFGRSEIAAQLYGVPRARFYRAHRGPVNMAKRWLPGRFKDFIRQLLPGP